MDTKKELEPMREIQGEQGVEAPKIPEQNLEVGSWVEKIEKKFARVPNDTPTPNDDNVVVQNPQAQQPSITLPVTQQTMQKGKKGKVEEGVTWLVAWVVRQIKMFAKLGRKVRLQDIPEVKDIIKPLDH